MSGVRGCPGPLSNSCGPEPLVHAGKPAFHAAPKPSQATVYPKDRLDTQLSSTPRVWALDPWARHFLLLLPGHAMERLPAVQYLQTEIKRPDRHPQGPGSLSWPGIPDGPSLGWLRELLPGQWEVLSALGPSCSVSFFFQILHAMPPLLVTR